MEKIRYNVSCAYKGSNQKRWEAWPDGGSAWIGIEGTLVDDGDMFLP